MSQEIDRRSLLKFLGTSGTLALTLAACGRSQDEFPPNGGHHETVITNQMLGEYLLDVWNKLIHDTSTSFKDDKNARVSYTIPETSEFFTMQKENDYITSLRYSHLAKDKDFMYVYSFDKQDDNWNINIIHQPSNTNWDNNQSRQNYNVGNSGLKLRTFQYIKNVTNGRLSATIQSMNSR